MLKMRAHAAVFGDRGPAVFEDLDAWLAGIDHRLDGENHAFTELHAAAAFAKVRHLRILMHACSDAVADKIANHGKTFRLDQLLHRRADVAERRARLYGFDRRAERSLRGFEQ